MNFRHVDAVTQCSEQIREDRRKGGDASKDGFDKDLVVGSELRDAASAYCGEGEEERRDGSVILGNGPCEVDTRSESRARGLVLTVRSHANATVPQNL